MKKYSIGFRDFERLRNTVFLYINKTRMIHKLISSGKYYFLNRPHRFGKSLILSAIKEIFLGKKELFEGLWIYEMFDADDRPDVDVKTDTHSYALEFKLDKNADAALKQIFDEEYRKKFQLDQPKKVAIDINLLSMKKAIADYAVEKVG